MFPTQTYIQRRNELKKLVGKGIIILFGNNESSLIVGRMSRVNIIRSDKTPRSCTTSVRSGMALWV